MNPNLKCIACRRKRNMEVELTPVTLSSDLTIFMCRTDECSFPLNSKTFYKYVYRVSSEGLFQRRNQSEVPSLEDLFNYMASNQDASSDRANPDNIEILNVRPSETESLKLPSFLPNDSEINSYSSTLTSHKGVFPAEKETSLESTLSLNQNESTASMFPDDSRTGSYSSTFTSQNGAFPAEQETSLESTVSLTQNESIASLFPNDSRTSSYSSTAEQETSLESTLSLTQNENIASLFPNDSRTSSYSSTFTSHSGAFPAEQESNLETTLSLNQNENTASLFPNCSGTNSYSSTAEQETSLESTLSLNQNKSIASLLPNDSRTSNYSSTFTSHSVAFPAEQETSVESTLSLTQNESTAPVEKELSDLMSMLKSLSDDNILGSRKSPKTTDEQTEEITGTDNCSTSLIQSDITPPAEDKVACLLFPTLDHLKASHEKEEQSRDSVLQDELTGTQCTYLMQNESTGTLQREMKTNFVSATQGSRTEGVVLSNSHQLKTLDEEAEMTTNVDLRRSMGEFFDWNSLDNGNLNLSPSDDESFDFTSFFPNDSGSSSCSSTFPLDNDKQESTVCLKSDSSKKNGSDFKAVCNLDEVSDISNYEGGNNAAESKEMSSHCSEISSCSQLSSSENSGKKNIDSGSGIETTQPISPLRHPLQTVCERFFQTPSEKSFASSLFDAANHNASSSGLEPLTLTASSRNLSQEIELKTQTSPAELTEISADRTRSDLPQTTSDAASTSSKPKRKLNYVLLRDTKSKNSRKPIVKNSQKTVIRYKNITAEFEPFVEVDISISLAGETQFFNGGGNGSKTASPSKSEEVQGIDVLNVMHSPTRSTTGIVSPFGSDDIPITHLSFQNSEGTKESSQSSDSKGLQSDVTKAAIKGRWPKRCRSVRKETRKKVSESHRSISPEGKETEILGSADFCNSTPEAEEGCDISLTELQGDACNDQDASKSRRKRKRKESAVATLKSVVQVKRAKNQTPLSEGDTDFKHTEKLPPVENSAFPKEPLLRFPFTYHPDVFDLDLSFNVSIPRAQITKVCGPPKISESEQS